MPRGHRFWRRILVADTQKKRPREVSVRSGREGFLVLVGEENSLERSVHCFWAILFSDEHEKSIPSGSARNLSRTLPLGVGCEDPSPKAMTPRHPELLEASLRR